MSTDILYPILIGLGCLLLVYIVHLVTRPKPTRADITVPSGATASGGVGKSASVTVALADWHRANEAALLDFFDHHDQFPRPSDSSISADTDASIEAFQAASTSHPAPDMQAELAALHTAAEAMHFAQARTDTDAATRHHDVYMRYREAWLERLWQFTRNQQRVAELRKGCS